MHLKKKFTAMLFVVISCGISTASTKLQKKSINVDISQLNATGLIRKSSMKRFTPGKETFLIVFIEDLSGKIPKYERLTLYETPAACATTASTSVGNFVCVRPDNGDIYVTSWAKVAGIRNNTVLKTKIRWKEDGFGMLDTEFTIKFTLDKTMYEKSLNIVDNKCARYTSSQEIYEEAHDPRVFRFKVTEHMRDITSFKLIVNGSILTPGHLVSLEVSIPKRNVTRKFEKLIQRVTVSQFTVNTDIKEEYFAGDQVSVRVFTYNTSEYYPAGRFYIFVNYINTWQMCAREKKCFKVFSQYRQLKSLKKSTVERCFDLKPRVEIYNLTDDVISCYYHSSVNDLRKFAYVLLNGTTKVLPNTESENRISKRSLETSNVHYKWKVKVKESMTRGYVQCGVYDARRMKAPAFSEKLMFKGPTVPPKNVSTTKNSLKKTTPRIESRIVSAQNITDITNTIVREVDLIMKEQNTNISALENVLRECDQVLNTTKSLIVDAELKNKTSSILLRVLDYVGAKASSMVNSTVQNITIAKNNIVLYVGYTQNASVTLTASAKNSHVEMTMQKADDYKHNDNDLASIRLPSEAFNNSRVVYSYFFKTNALFINNENIDNETFMVQSSIISATVYNRTIDNLSQPVIMTFKKTMKTDGKDICSFWDTKKETPIIGVFGAWSTRDCHLNDNHDITSDTISCSCNHLTNFALLLDVTQSSSNPFALQIVTWIGCSISLVGLFLTAITFLFFSKLRKNLPSKILLQLCFALIGLLLTFLIGAERAMSSRMGCQATAAIINFFLLASFCWMFVEAANLYRYCVQVFKTAGDFSFLCKASLMAWGLPALLTTFVIFLRPDELGNQNICIVHGKSFYYGVLIPASTILALNALILAVSLRSLYKSNPATTTADRASLMVKLRITFACATLLGLSWSFGVLAVSYVTNVFQWMFCVTTSLQGFLIFMFHTVRNSDVRKEWRRKFRPHYKAQLAFNNSTKTYELRSRNNTVLGDAST